MSMWLAIVLTGLGSYMFRVAPLLLGDWMRLPEGADAMLRHAAMGAMTALLVVSAQQVWADPISGDSIAVALALAITGILAVAGRSMPVVVLCGGAAYGLALCAIGVLTV